MRFSLWDDVGGRLFHFAMRSMRSDGPGLSAIRLELSTTLHFFYVPMYGMQAKGCAGRDCEMDLARPCVMADTRYLENYFRAEAI